MVNDARRSPGQGTAAEKSEGEQSHALRGDQTNQRSGCGPERHAHAKLTRAARYLKSEQPVDTNRSERQSERTEKGDEDEKKAFSHPRIRGGLLQRDHFVSREPVVGVSERAAGGDLQRFGFSFAFDDECHLIFSTVCHPDWQRQTDRTDNFAITRIGDRFRVRDDAYDREPWARIVEAPAFNALA